MNIKELSWSLRHCSHPSPPSLPFPEARENIRRPMPWRNGSESTDFQYIEAPDDKAYKGVRPSLILTIPGKNKERNFWIMSHVDVVPPGDLKLWNTDPYKVVEKDGKLYGRGVEDNQHGIVSSVMAALALKNAGIEPEDTVKLLFVADE